MPKHLAIDVNYLFGTVFFNNTRNVDVYFKRQDGTQVYFTKAPKILLTPADSTTMPPFRTTYIKDGNLFIGVTIKMAVSWTGNVDWVVLEVV